MRVVLGSSPLHTWRVPSRITETVEHALPRLSGDFMSENDVSAMTSRKPASKGQDYQGSAELSRRRDLVTEFAGFGKRRNRLRPA